MSGQFSVVSWLRRGLVIGCVAAAISVPSFLSAYAQTAGAEATTSGSEQAETRFTDDDIIEAATFDLGSYLRQNPLAPPDTSSPRAALESFVLLMDEAGQTWREVRDGFQASDSRSLTSDQRRQLKYVLALFGKAKGIFDLSAIPETARERASMELVLQFQEILDRIYLPHMSEVPGEGAGSFLDSQAISMLPERWKIPGTNITFARKEKAGEGVEYLVTSESVARIPEDYELIKTFPSRRDLGDDLYDYYIYTPGNLVAPKWFELIKSGPDWLRHHFLSQAYWQWIALFLLSLVAIAFPVLLYRWERMRAVPVSELRRRLRSLMMPLVVIATVGLFRFLVEGEVNITGSAMVAVGTIATAVVWTSLGWLVFRCVELLSVWIIRNPVTASNSLDSSLLFTGFRLLGLIAAVLVTGYGATRIGIPVYGVIAGLGVGGLAVALAAQPTLENLIGGIILYADRMVRVGEFCQFDEFSGTIEAIGIRSTRIRALDRTVITVSNADLAKRKLINFSRRDQFHLKHVLTLRYETSREQLTAIADQIRIFLETHEMVAESPLRVNLVALNSYSLDIEVFAYVLTADRNVFLKFQELFLIEAMKIVEDNGAKFALPARRAYLAREADGEVQLEQLS
ncbi:mechanosensitive ion channel family protein [Roseibium suaedae]|uniref:MscS family membrane protein n=1 Tax=Roseibium suaedae TaxID=735517 RepID=A0A1M7L0Z6_9HYPH|nr:mechanosensitive ion channel family protein [Roseibium suaedae]SHM71177.1 MscS family membrane protein [Roseibium suaedae]